MQKTTIALSELNSFFATSAKKVFWQSDITEIYRRYRSAWRLPKAMTSATFIEWLLAHTQLVQVELSSTDYSRITRYAWSSSVSPVHVALSTRRQSYLSHASALRFYGLGGSEREFYVNHEQREKPPNNGTLTQVAMFNPQQLQPATPTNQKPYYNNVNFGWSGEKGLAAVHEFITYLLKREERAAAA